MSLELRLLISVLEADEFGDLNAKYTSYVLLKMKNTTLLQAAVGHGCYELAAKILARPGFKQRAEQKDLRCCNYSHQDV